MKFTRNEEENERKSLSISTLCFLPFNFMVCKICEEMLGKGK
jgi:hypothetical protein